MILLSNNTRYFKTFQNTKLKIYVVIQKHFKNITKKKLKSFI